MVHMVGNKLKELRIKKGLSQQRLAKLARVPQSTIWYIEQGQRSPTLKTLEKLAKALEVHIQELVSQNDSLNKQKKEWN